MANYIFSTPYVEEGPTGGHRLFYFYKLRRGLSVAKLNGSYFTIRFPDQDSVDMYEEFYIGGHEHPVNEATKANLINAGIGITEANFTVA